LDRINENLQKLAQALSRLIAMLKLDKECLWAVKKLSRDLQWCQFLIANGYDDAELRDLSASISSMFQGGMGSYNDYCPAVQDANGRFQVIPGMEDLDAANRDVLDYAVQLRARE
jgi:hypothetical protein